MSLTRSWGNHVSIFTTLVLFLSWKILGVLYWDIFNHQGRYLIAPALRIPDGNSLWGVFWSPQSHFGSKYFEAGQHPKFYSVEYGSVPGGWPSGHTVPCISSTFTRKSILPPAPLADEASRHTYQQHRRVALRPWSGNNLTLTTTPRFTKAQLRGIIITDSGLWNLQSILPSK